MDETLLLATNRKDHQQHSRSPDENPQAGTTSAGQTRQSQGPAIQDNAIPAVWFQDWLDWQCRMIAGVMQGVIYLPEGKQNTLQPVTSWPANADTADLLKKTATEALSAGESIVQSLKPCNFGARRHCDVAALPVRLNTNTTGIVAIAFSHRPEPQQRTVLQLLQWGAVWLESLARHHSKIQHQHSTILFECLSSALSREPLEKILMAITNKLAQYFQCERVSLGLRQNLRIRLQSLSHTAKFDPRMALVQRIEAAMEEAVDQGKTVIYPAAGSISMIVRAHAELAANPGHPHLCTIPLPGSSEPLGALTLECSTRTFSPETIDFCQSIVHLIAPALELKWQQKQRLLGKLAQSLKTLSVRLFGPGHWQLKSACGALLAVTLLSAMVKGEYRVTAPAVLQSTQLQAIVAPQEGYLKKVFARPGDKVQAGDVLASLEDSHLLSEQQQWQSELRKHQQEYHQALARQDRVQMGLMRAKIGQTEAQLKLAEERLAKTRLRAPIDGVILRGDLSQLLGAPVKIGQVLFEVAPLGNYHALLQVDEHDIAAVREGQSGRLVLASQPSQPMNFTIERIIPLAETMESGNYFPVEAELDTHDSRLRPGMQGIAKISAGQRSLLWIWSHPVWERLKLWAWTLGL